jgi:predicted nucleic acid-binding protein
VTDYIIDSYAWVEYFAGSRKGMPVARVLANAKNRCFVIAPCIAELHDWALRRGIDFSQRYHIIRSHAQVLNLDEHEWMLAGMERYVRRKQAKDFGLIDACIIVKQIQMRCKVVSGDKHFKYLPNVVFLS